MSLVHRVGSVPYLNAKPLIASLASRSDVELLLLPPRPLAGALAEGRVDVALIPTFEFLRQPAYRAVPNIAIASKGPVRSVFLFHRVPIENVRRVAVDQSSLSSAALVRVILRGRHGLEPIYADAPPNLAALDRGADAVLLIGDPAMRAAARSDTPRLDLGEEWQKLTGLPFVYAVFAMRRHEHERRVSQLLLEAKARGMEQIDGIAEEQSASLGIDVNDLRSYLREAIRFDLGSDELAGMEAFRDRACDLGLLESRRRIDVVEAVVTSTGTS